MNQKEIEEIVAKERAANEKAAKSQFYRDFTIVANAYKDSNNLNSSDAVICRISLLKVYQDAKIDIEFITQRRLLNGASKCKIAGIMLWRLSKTSILRFVGSKTCDKSEKYLYMNFHLALTYVCKVVLNVEVEKILKEFGKELSELKYLIENRHTNQEMIALFFQLMCHLDYCCNDEKE